MTSIDNVNVIPNTGQVTGELTGEKFTNSCLFISIYDYIRCVEQEKATVEGIRIEVGFKGNNKDFNFADSHDSISLEKWLNNSGYRIQFYNINRAKNIIEKSFIFPLGSQATKTIPIASYGGHFELITSIDSKTNPLKLQIKENSDYCKKIQKYQVKFYIKNKLVNVNKIKTEKNKLFEIITPVLDNNDKLKTRINKLNIKYRDLDDKKTEINKNLKELDENKIDKIQNLSQKLFKIDNEMKKIVIEINKLQKKYEESNKLIDDLLSISQQGGKKNNYKYKYLKYKYKYLIAKK